MRMHDLRGRGASSVALFVAALLGAWSAGAQNPHVVDLAGLETNPHQLLRVSGADNDGSFGVPVAGGFDVDGDGLADVAMASMRASPNVGGTVRTGAGVVHLVFGDGTGGGSLDTAGTHTEILEFAGSGMDEVAGSEIWMDDVTGDGLGDLLIARQNYSPGPSRIGAGAFTIVVGGPELRTFAAGEMFADLADSSTPPRFVTFVGPSSLARLGMWIRTGDVTGDGIADIVVSADQTSEAGEMHRGAVYVIRGGGHLSAEQTIDLANFGATGLASRIARVTPPPGSAEFHLGATVQIADLDGNGTAEVLMAAALNRAGGILTADGAPAGSAHGTGGAPNGRVFIEWDDNFSGAWAPGFTFVAGSGPGTSTRIDGIACNESFGEELLGGLDYDGDLAPDLFVGDIAGNCGTVSQPFAGSGHLFFDAALLKGATIDRDAPPSGVARTDFFGADSGDISADTALHGDFDADGIADLAFSSPHADPLGRFHAGILHVFFGKDGVWPTEVDLGGPFPDASVLRMTEIWGAKGRVGQDEGDTLAYSAAAGDVDGDGCPDLITNEMLGNGVLPAAEDAGNLIVIGAKTLRPTRVPALSLYASWLLAGMLLVAALGIRAS